MKKLKLCILLTFCFLILGVSCKKIYAQESKTISIDGEWIDGNFEDNIDFYKFTLPSAGTITYTLQTYSADTGISLLDDNLSTTYSKIQCANGTLDIPQTETEVVILEKGTYTFSIWALWTRTTGPFRLKVSFTPANNNEIEPNNNFKTAMELQSNQKIIGLLSANDSVDFYKFTINCPETINIMYNFKNDFSLSILDSDFITIEATPSEGKTGRGIIQKKLTSGTYYVKIESFDADFINEITGTYTLELQSMVSSLKLKKLTLEQGQQYTISPIIEPQNATNQQLTWQSSNTSVATIDASGKIKAKHAGVTTITATTEDGSDLSANCIVTVLPKKATITTLRSLLKETGVTITLRKQTGVSGYQITYSTSKTFKNKKLITTKRTKVTQKKLARNKKYYFKARAYYTYKNTRYYGAWGDTITIENLF